MGRTPVWKEGKIKAWKDGKEHSLEAKTGPKHGMMSRIRAWRYTVGRTTVWKETRRTIVRNFGKTRAWKD